MGKALTWGIYVIINSFNFYSCSCFLNPKTLTTFQRRIVFQRLLILMQDSQLFAIHFFQIIFSKDALNQSSSINEAKFFKVLFAA